MDLAHVDAIPKGAAHKGKEITALTSLRGLAATGVVIFHFRDQFGHAIDLGRLGPLFSRGYLFVDFFFILSGYVIALSYARLFAENIAINNYMTFLVKRLARVYPLHIVVLAGFVVSEVCKYAVPTSAYPPFSINTFDALIANIFLIQAWGFYNHFTWNHPAWSISTEWFAYLIFPFLALCLPKIRSIGSTAMVSALCFTSLAFVVQSGGTGNIDVPVSIVLLRCVPSFILGMMIYQISKLLSNLQRAIVRSDAAFAASLVASTLSLAFIVPSVVAIIAFFFTVLTGSMNRGRISRALSVGPLYFLGEISYSVYLVHTLLLRIWQMLFQIVWHNHISEHAAWMAFTILLITVFAASIASYYLIEKPGRDFLGGVALRQLAASSLGTPTEH